MKQLSFVVLLLAVLLLAVPAQAGCYGCTVTSTGDPACETKETSGYTNCKTWGSNYTRECKTSGESCGSGGGRLPENIVQNDKCSPSDRLMLLHSEVGHPMTRSMTLVAVLVHEPGS